MNDWGRGRGITSPIKDVEMDEMTSEKEENTYDTSIYLFDIIHIFLEKLTQISKIWYCQDII